MATSNDIITPALWSIGATSDINPATPELLEAAFKRFVVMMQNFEVNGMQAALGTDFTENPPATGSEEINNAVGSDLSLECVFAVWVAPIFRLPIDPDVKSLADTAMKTIRIIAFSPSAPEWPETLPIGGGNTRGPKGRVYFPVPEYTKEQQGIEPETEEVTP